MLVSCFPISIGLEKVYFADEKLNKLEESESTTDLYQLFLNGNTSVEYNGEWFNSTALGIPKGEPEKRATVLYSFFDINGDGTPELILAFAGKYLYLSVANGELFVWRFVSSSFPLYITKNKVHITQAWAGLVGAEETYHCYLLDYSGNELFDLNFSRSDCNQDGKFDDKDEYKFDGVLVSQAQWIQLTRKYLYTNDEGNENIKDEIDWKVLYKAVK